MGVVGVSTIPSIRKQAFLRSLFRASRLAGNLKLALEAFQDNGFAACKTGRVIISHSGSGQSTSFELPSVARGFSQDTVLDLSEELLQIFTDALGGTSYDETGASDQTYFDTMMLDDRLVGVSQVHEDYTLLRTPSTFGSTR